MLDKPIKIKAKYFFPVVVFLGFTIWWFWIRQFDLDFSRNMRQLWGATYQILALYGAIVGLYISNKWGGYKSVLGRVILAFSIGLFLQVWGQTYSSWYVYHYDAEAPSYPGFGDIGFFGSVLAYIYGVILLAKVSGIKNKLKEIHNKFWAVLIPAAILTGSYIYFLKGYEFDWTDKLRIFLDFGYPLGQAIYVSIAILALLMSRNILGGIMRRPILFLIFALIFQYFSDFFFLYQAYNETWYVGNINDYLYASSYFIMTLAIISIGNAFYKIRET